jgi:hypothetical protein
MKQAAIPGTHHTKRDFTHIRFETAAAHAAKSAAIIFDKKLGTRPSVRGTSDAHHCCERSSTPRCGETGDAVDDFARFLPMFHVKAQRYAARAAYCISLVRQGRKRPGQLCLLQSMNESISFRPA